MKLFPFIALLATALFLGCHAKKDPNILKVGVIAGPESELLETASKLAKEKYGLTVEIITFTDYVTPNTALNDGSIDVNIFQHKPYLEAQIKDRGYPLLSIGNTFVFPIAAYSQKINHLSELKDAAIVALPNDPTNLARSLVLLQKQGLITLKQGVTDKATITDIINNPKNLHIIELDAAQLPRSLQDVDLAIINTTYASQANLLPARDGLFVEDRDSPYVNIMVARESDKNKKALQDFLKAYQSEEVLQHANRLFQGNVIKGW